MVRIELASNRRLPSPIVFDRKTERAITMIAKWCESGDVAAVYRSIGGADPLDRSLWRRPNFRSYFIDGTIDLDLPLVDEKLRPSRGGYMERCTREIFVNEQDVERRVETLQSPRTSHAGRKPTHDWAALQEKFWELWNEKGDFREPDQMLDWNSQAVAAKTLLEFLKGGAAPDQKIPLRDA